MGFSHLWDVLLGHPRQLQSTLSCRLPNPGLVLSKSQGEACRKELFNLFYRFSPSFPYLPTSVICFQFCCRLLWSNSCFSEASSSLWSMSQIWKISSDAKPDSKKKPYQWVTFSWLALCFYQDSCLLGSFTQYQYCHCHRQPIAEKRGMPERVVVRHGHLSSDFYLPASCPRESRRYQIHTPTETTIVTCPFD